MQIKGAQSFSVVFCTARFCSVVLLLAPQQFIVLHDAPGMIRCFVIVLLHALIQCSMEELIKESEVKCLCALTSLKLRLVSNLRKIGISKRFIWSFVVVCW